MVKFAHVLCPTDLSEASLPAFRYAAAVARWWSPPPPDIWLSVRHPED